MTRSSCTAALTAARGPLNTSHPSARRRCSTCGSATRLRGLAVGAYGVIYSTGDGGKVWSQVPFEPAPLPDAPKVEVAEDDMEAEVDLGFEFHLNAIARGPAGGGLHLGAEAGRLFRSDDDGATWRELPSPYDGSFHGLLPLDG